MQRRARFGASVLALLLGALSLSVDSAHAQMQRNAQAVCAECHNNLDSSLNRALTHAEGLACLSCHHLDMSNEPTKIAVKRVEVCKGCHQSLKPAHTRGRAGEPTCTQCHSIHDDTKVAEQPLPSARCQTCHEKPHALHATVTSGGPECTSCHTLHGEPNIKATDVQTSRSCVSCHRGTHPSHTATGKVSPACTTCHSLSSDAKAAAIPAGAKLSALCFSCHKGMPAAHASVKENAPQCADCHTYQSDARMPNAQVAISERCGSCHADALKSYKEGGHSNGLAVNAPNPDLPTCVTCHATHGAAGGAAAVRLAATEQCITCHSDEKLAKKYELPRYAGESYVKDFHGATLKFMAKHPKGASMPAVMTCSDCHGAHGVTWTAQMAVADVCIDCHETGDAKLAGAWLGHTQAGPTNQPLVWLVRLFYYVLIPFVLAGLVLHIAFQLIDQRRRGARVVSTLRNRFARDKKSEATVIRFNRLERMEHFGSMVTFILLCMTGLPQTRPNGALSHRIIEFFGGIGTLRFIHRGIGLIFVALLVQHVARAILRALRKRQLPVMATTVQDFHDVVGTVKHFIWGTPRPKTGKFDFSEKFEYWGLFMGGTLMSATGVGLLFPELITHYLPGLVVAMFRVMHGLEATFAVLVVALWHSYGVMLRPEVFPLDTSIFTGKISKHRLEEEHRLEYERLFPEEIEEHAEEVGAAD